MKDVFVVGRRRRRQLFGLPLRNDDNGGGNEDAVGTATDHQRIRTAHNRLVLVLLLLSLLVVYYIYIYM